LVTYLKQLKRYSNLIDKKDIILKYSSNLDRRIPVEIMQIVGLGIVSAIIIIVLRAQRPEIAIQVSIITGIVIFLLLASKLSAVMDMLQNFSDKAAIDTVYFTTVLKIIGIAYISEFGAEVCKDAGESSIASKIELAGKVIIVVLAVPIVSSLLELVTGIMP
jgi:stage III sporulation protein AD